jgi:hypothetical protein
MDDSEALTKPINRRRIENQDASNNICVRCKSMFSQSGLRDLNSPEGFKHYNRRGCEGSARNGCVFCMMIVQGAPEKWEQSDGLTFFTELNGCPTVDAKGESHPNTVPVRFDGISSSSDSSENGKFVRNFLAYTTEGLSFKAGAKVYVNFSAR